MDLCRSSKQGPASGDYFVQDVAGESLIIVRDQNAALRAFYNVCRHRGTRLCEEPGGTRVRDSMSIPRLDLRSRRTSDRRPAHGHGAGFNKTEYSLGAVRLALWEGFIFVNLAEHAATLEEVFAPLVGKFTHWNLPALRSARRIDYDVRANWKLIFENYSECYHCPGVHPMFRKFRLTIPPRTICAKGRSSAGSCRSTKAPV